MPLAFALLARYGLPIWYRYPTTVLLFQLRAREQFWRWVCLAGAYLPIQLAVLYGAGAAYQASDLIIFAFIAAIGGMGYVKNMVVTTGAIIRHTILTLLERRVAVRPLTRS